MSELPNASIGGERLIRSRKLHSQRGLMYSNPAVNEGFGIQTKRGRGREREREEEEREREREAGI